jgi:general secretion pathway protein L
MNILSIDLGTYSVKFYNCSIVRKSIVINNYNEIIIDKVRNQLDSEATISEIQLEIVSSFLKKGEFDGVIIFQLPNEMITTRYLTLPVSNKKQAEQMIPFQLDDDLPYQSSTAHVISKLHKQGSQIFAQVDVTQSEYFQKLYEYLKLKNIIPGIMTAENFIVQSFIEKNNYDESICILDIGHHTTKAYFVRNNLILTNHTSHVAGKVLDEVISQTYNTSNQEAVIYKHQNCYFLIESQYDEVEADQREFGKLMKAAFWPLVMEMKRWELGLRVKYKTKIDKIMITGGTSNINNIDNFLAFYLSIKVEHLEPYDDLLVNSFPVEQNLKHTMSMSHMMAVSQLNKTPVGNFLIGSFLGKIGQSIPINSSAFLLSRTFIICFFLIISMKIESRFINKDIRVLDTKILKNLKKNTSDITTAQRNKYKKDPDSIYKLLKKRTDIVTQEVNAIASANSINAIDALISLGKSIGSNSVIDMENFNITKGQVTALFSSNDPKELEQLKNHLNKLGLYKSKITYKKGALNLKLVYRDINE